MEPQLKWGTRLGWLGEDDAAYGAEDVEDLQDPDEHVDDDHAVEQRFDSGSHGDVGVDEAQDDADDEQANDDGDQNWIDVHLISSGNLGPEG